MHEINKLVELPCMHETNTLHLYINKLVVQN
jgi:hypothetical protein